MGSLFFFNIFTMELIKLEKKLKLDPKVRNFQWYRQLFVKGRLYFDGNLIESRVFEEFRLAVKTVEEIYPGLWDIDIKIHTNEFVVNKKVKIDIRGIVIKFPIVNITNSRRNRHTIRDLFVRTVFQKRDGRLHLGNVQGGRTTFTFAEVNSRYLHSHLQGISIDNNFRTPGYGNFCTGSGDINISIADINSLGFSPERFISYLLNLQTLVSWESLEGVPYRKMAEINSLTQGARVFNYYEGNTTYLINVIKMHKAFLKTGLKLNFKLENSVLKLIEDETYTQFLNRIPIDEGQKHKFLCLNAGPDNPHTYYVYGSTGNRPVIPIITNKYIFQGVEVPVVITDVPVDEEPVIEYVFHPRVKEAIKKEFEYAANKAIIRKNTVDRYKDRVSTVREDSEPNPVLVSADS